MSLYQVINDYIGDLIAGALVGAAEVVFTVFTTVDCLLLFEFSFFISGPLLVL